MDTSEGPSLVERLPLAKEILDDFILPPQSYSQQYANVYFNRLQLLKPRCEAAARKKNPDYPVAERILYLSDNKKAWIIGTLYCDMALKPSVLEDLKKAIPVSRVPVRERYADPETDAVILEDTSGRLALVGSKLNTDLLVTGMVCAFLGEKKESGDFEVEDICFPGLAPQLKSTDFTDKDDILVLVSGLNISGAADQNKLDLLSEYLTGEMYPFEYMGNIKHLIIAGNSVDIKATVTSKRSHRFGYDSSTYNAAPMQTFNTFINEVVCTVPVTIIPGDSDYAPIMLPQQPLLRDLFPVAKMEDNLSLTTNPCRIKLENGLEIVGTSGQILKDLLKYSFDEKDSIDVLIQSLSWQHMAPAAPDTLCCYPFANSDPFVLNSTPNIYFSANHKSFETKLLETDDGIVCRTILIPSFSETNSIVLVNLKTLETTELNFDTSNAME